MTNAHGAMLLLCMLFACVTQEAPCATATQCLERADAAESDGKAEEEFAATFDGCQLGDEPLCARLAKLYLRPSVGHYDQAKSLSQYKQGCERSYFPSCMALGDQFASAKDILNAANWYHKGCELGDQPLCVRSAAYAVEVQRKEPGLLALPDAVRACEFGDVPTCHAAITIAGGVGPPAGQDLDAFTKSMLERACAAGEAASCAR